VPAPRYGITSVDQKKLDAVLASAKKEDYVRLADKLGWGRPLVPKK